MLSLFIIGSNRTLKAAPTADAQHNISFQIYLQCLKPNAKYASQTFSASKTAPPHLGQASPSAPLQEGSQFRRGGHTKTPQNFEMIKMFKGARDAQKIRKVPNILMLKMFKILKTFQFVPNVQNVQSAHVLDGGRVREERG